MTSLPDPSDFPRLSPGLEGAGLELAGARDPLREIEIDRTAAGDALIELTFMTQVSSTTLLAAALRVEAYPGGSEWALRAAARLRYLHLRKVNLETRWASRHVGDAMTPLPEQSASGRYRKKPVVIDARQVTDANASEIASWINVNDAHASFDAVSDGVVISTLEGDMRADPGDWVIRGVKGEFYPCKPDIFEATYEAVL